MKRGDKVCTQIVKNSSIKELLPIDEGDAVIYSDGSKTYDGLVNYCYKEHFREQHANSWKQPYRIENFGRFL